MIRQVGLARRQLPGHQRAGGAEAGLAGENARIAVVQGRVGEAVFQATVDNPPNLRGAANGKVVFIEFQRPGFDGYAKS